MFPLSADLSEPYLEKSEPLLRLSNPSTIFFFCAFHFLIHIFYQECTESRKNNKYHVLKAKNLISEELFHRGWSNSWPFATVKREEGRVKDILQFDALIYCYLNSAQYYMRLMLHMHAIHHQNSRFHAV
jgi:hypothetical protein